ERLVAQADVLVENFRPGKLAAMGFDPSELIARHPNLIVCSLSGFGQFGSEADRPAYDHIIQARSGLMAVNKNEEGKPQRIGFPLIDYATATHAAYAILAALLRRVRQDQDGSFRTQGEWLDVSMMGVAMNLLAPAYASYAVSG